jgi:hypothetical protein
MAMRLFVCKLLRMLSIPVLFKGIRRRKTMAVQAVTARRRNISAALSPEMVATLVLSVLARVVWAERSR